MRSNRLVVLVALVVAIAAPACSVGKGVGAAKGVVYAYGCSESGDYCASGTCGSPESPAPYDLKPSFFAGEPIDDLRQYNEGSGIMNNRLIVRLQSSGAQIERIDVLTFDIVSSYEVARCVRGRVDPVNGKNDWDEANCYRASDNAPGRMRVQYDSSVHAALTMRGTCPGQLSQRKPSSLVADAISAPVPLSYASAVKPAVTDGSWSSWVEFQEFGGAAQWNRSPTARDSVDWKFRVGLGDRIYASAFLLTLIDDGVVHAAIANKPKPASSIGGTLGGDPSTGRFDFDIARGQGAQFFP